jgi:hypothetical protein
MIQGCLLRVKKCTVGLSQEVSSSVPARTRRRVSAAAVPGLGPEQIHEPHSGQTHRFTVRPLAAMRWIRRGSAPVRRNAFSLTTTAIENALLVMRWQSRQWQA